MHRMKLSGMHRLWAVLGATIVVAAAVPTVANASWSVQSSEAPSGAKESQLYGVSCISEGGLFCEAVGVYVNSSGEQKALAEQASIPWEPELPPEPNGATNAVLLNVSCITGSFCMAVGRYEEGGLPVALAEKWSVFEHGWELQTLRFPAGTTASELGSVSCVSLTECMAVGNFHNSTGEHNLAEKWTSSGGWVAEEPPAVSGAGYIGLDGVSCAKTGNCLAVGEYRNSLGVELTESDEWSSGSWSATAMNHPAGAGHMVVPSVSCPVAKECVAVGFYTSSGTIVSLGEEWEPGWASQTTQNVAGASATELEGVSCPEGIKWCIAVGRSVKSGVASALGEQNESGVWELLTMAVPAGAKASSLYRLSCLSLTSCTAVGGYVDSAGKTQMLVEQNY